MHFKLGNIAFSSNKSTLSTSPPWLFGHCWIFSPARGASKLALAYSQQPPLTGRSGQGRLLRSITIMCHGDQDCRQAQGGRTDVVTDVDWCGTFLKWSKKKSPWVSMLRKSHPWLGWCGVPPWCMSNLVHKFDERPGHSWIGCRISLKHVKTLGLRDNPQYFMGKTVFGQTHR